MATAGEDSLTGDEDRRPRFQFTLRGLLVFAFLVSVLVSMGPRIGPAVVVLLVLQARALKRIETDCVADSYGFKYPFLSLPGCLSAVILPFAFVTTVALVLCWLFRPVGWAG